MVYFLSDYVFDGSDGSYEIVDEPVPINEDGRHKLAAAQAVRELALSDYRGAGFAARYSPGSR